MAKIMRKGEFNRNLIRLPIDYEGELRQLIVRGTGREKPSFIIINDFDITTEMDKSFSDSREQAFCQIARAHGIPVDIAQQRDVLYWKPGDAMIDWLKALPKPCGIGCASDYLAREFLALCHFCGVYVPEKVAVVGVDNDEPSCNTTVTRQTTDILAIPDPRLVEAVAYIR